MIIRNMSEWRFLVGKLRELPRICYDSETLDYGFPNVTITGFSLGWESGGEYLGAYIPVNHTYGVQLSWEDVQEGLAELLSRPDSPWVVGHNLKYDRNVLVFNSIEMHPRIIDTMILSWMVDTVGVGTYEQRLADTGYHGLKEQTFHRYGHKMANLGEFCRKEDGVFLTHEVDIQTMAPYAIEDVIYPLRIADDIKNELQRVPILREVYNEWERPLIFSLGDMEVTGVEMDMTLIGSMGIDMAAELINVHEKVYELRVGQDFPPQDRDLVWDLADAYEKVETDKSLKPHERGKLRKKIFEDEGLDPKTDPLVNKVRDDTLRPELLRYPHLAHKIFNLNSPMQLNTVLFGESKVKPIGYKGKNKMFSTSGENMQIWAEDGHEIAKHLLRLRELSKLHSTYVEGIQKRLGPDGRLRTRYNRPIATGRLSSRNPNLQNIVNSSEFPIRRAFVGTGVAGARVDDRPDRGYCYVERIGSGGAPLGGYRLIDGKVDGWWGDPPWVMCVADYSQLEMRVLAHMSGDKVLTEAIREGTDLHGLTAKLVFDAVPNDIDPNDVKAEYPEWRDNAKPINFGIIYGMGAKKLSKQLGISVDDAEGIIQNYLNGYPGVEEYIKEQHDHVRSHGYVETLLKRRRHIPAGQLKFSGQDKWKVFAAQRKAQNSPIQGTAADIINVSMVRFSGLLEKEALETIGNENFMPPTSRIPLYPPLPFYLPIYPEWGRMLIQVHDEIVAEFHPSIANWGMDELVRTMESAFELSVPLKVDANLGYNWWDTK